MILYRCAQQFYLWNGLTKKIYFGSFMAFLEKLNIGIKAKIKQCPKKSSTKERIFLRLELDLNDYKIA
jgi:hypothetical protein